MIFASDLDNTLIYSYKRAEPSDICVEKKDGKELSFMKPESYELLKDIARNCTFIPITTRTLEQYRRIDFGFEPEYALVCHGARLLRNGEIDEDWEAETRKMLPEKLPAVKEEGALLYDIRYVDEYFIFAKSERPSEALNYLKKLINIKDYGVHNGCVDTNGAYNICAVHNKVYVMPNELDKGRALLRLKKLLINEQGLDEEIICAGDSLLDIPMLEAADIAVSPYSLGLNHSRGLVFVDEVFTEEVPREINRILMNS